MSNVHQVNCPRRAAGRSRQSHPSSPANPSYLCARVGGLIPHSFSNYCHNCWAKVRGCFSCFGGSQHHADTTRLGCKKHMKG